MKLFELPFIELTIVILLLIGVLIFVASSVVESIHIMDNNWVKPKYVFTLEWTAIGFVGIAFLLIFAYTIGYTILNT